MVLPEFLHTGTQAQESFWTRILCTRILIYFYNMSMFTFVDHTIYWKTDCKFPIKSKQIISRHVAAYTQVCECVYIIFTHTKKKQREHYLCFKLFCVVFIVLVQFLLIMSKQSNLKSFIKFAFKIGPSS